MIESDSRAVEADSDNHLELPNQKYEYLDHTADVQLHSWGDTLEESIEQLVISMYGYMTTDIDKVSTVYSMDFSVTGRDIIGMVYNLLETCLYNFCTEPFFIGRVCNVLFLERNHDECIISVRVWGESFDKEKHPPGTEIKAITYSNLQVKEKNLKLDSHNFVDIYVIVDI